MKHVLHLFGGTGSFSEAFRRSREWSVSTLDNNDDFDPDHLMDIRDATPDTFGTPPDVVLAAPPCKAFSLAAAHTHLDDDCRPITDFGRDSIEIVRAAIDLIHELDPDFWFMENPRAGLRTVMKETEWGVGSPTGTVSWCQYGADRMKPTDLWGAHPESMVYRFCGNGEDCHESAPRGSRTGTQGLDTDIDRWMMPFGLSLSVLEAVERDM